jgi:hypothetical protein
MDPAKSTGHVSISYIGAAPRKQTYSLATHRTGFFLALCLIVLGLIGALEYSTHVLPQVPSNVDIPNPASHFTLVKRQDDGSATKESDFFGAEPTDSFSLGPDPPASIDSVDISADAHGATTTAPLATNPNAYASGGAATTFVVSLSTPITTTRPTSGTKLAQASVASIVQTHGASASLRPAAATVLTLQISGSAVNQCAVSHSDSVSYHYHT